MDTTSNEENEQREQRVKFKKLQYLGYIMGNPNRYKIVRLILQGKIS